MSARLIHLAVSLVVVQFGACVAAAGPLPGPAPTTPASSTTAAAPQRPVEVFMWTGANTLADAAPAILENQLRFARRHDITPYTSGFRSVDEMPRYLDLLREHGLDRVWIETKPMPDETGNATIEQFVNEPERQAATIERLRQLMRTTRERGFRDVRVTIFDEAPLGDGFQYGLVKDERSAAWPRFKEYGPRAYAPLHRAIKEAMPEARVGIFLHHPFNAPPRLAGERSLIAGFMEEAEALGTRPDFIYSDIYRGYRDRSRGLESTNRYITDVVSYLREVADRWPGTPVYYLGQAHTIKVGYTPSRWAIDADVDAALRGGPNGIGWYWPNYAATHWLRDDHGNPAPLDEPVGYEPFVPNAWGSVGPAGTMYGTSRDRWTYAYLRALEAAGRISDPAERFTLWLYGDDFDHAEHRLQLWDRQQGRWETIGWFNPQQDAGGYRDDVATDLPRYSYDGRRHVVAFHALDRGRFLDPVRRLRLRIETPPGADGSTLLQVHAMPYRPTRNYLTEDEATRQVEDEPRWVRVNRLSTWADHPGRPMTAADPPIEIQLSAD